MSSDALRRSIPARLLILLGLMAQLLSALMLAAVDPVVEYAVIAPKVRSTRLESGLTSVDAGLTGYIEAREDVEEELGDAVSALAMSGMRGGAAVSYNGATQTAGLCAVGERWLEVCPRRLREGRWPDNNELERGAKLAVLDEDLAFALFNSEDPIGAEIEIERDRYTVTGTLEHSRGVGEVDEYCAYIPLGAAARQGIQLDTLTMHALSSVSSGLAQSFTEAMRKAWGAGELHDLRKERVGALLLSRLLVCAFGLALAFALGRKLMALAHRWKAQIDEKRRHSYVIRWLWPALIRIIAVLLGAAALLIFVWALLSFGISPVYSFTEWVPESLVSVKALKSVFWSRASDAAKLISIATPVSARIAFWGSIDRLGAVLFLLGLALGKRKAKVRAREGEE